MNNLKFYLDSNGLIVQKDGDGGDTAGREGDYWFYQGLKNNKNYASVDEFNRVLYQLQINSGVFIRNPVHYNDPKDFSRDQTIPLILAMGEMDGVYTALRILFKKQVKNFFRYQNGDIGFFEDLGYYIRSFKAWYLYPLLFLGDTQMLVNSIIRVIKGTDNDTSDDVNHTLVLIQAQKHYPTPISFLARKIYKWFRKGGILNAWKNYFKPESGANPFDKLYSELIGGM